MLELEFLSTMFTLNDSNAFIVCFQLIKSIKLSKFQMLPPCNMFTSITIHKACHISTFGQGYTIFFKELPPSSQRSPKDQTKQHRGTFWLIKEDFLVMNDTSDNEQISKVPKRRPRKMVPLLFSCQRG